ncbi:MAG TPA: hypothetical protein V6D05_00160 [Stenomitos sp.]
MLPRWNPVLTGGSLLLGASLLAGCGVGAPWPSTGPNPGAPSASGYQPREFFFPPSATAKAAYRTTTSIDNPANLPDTLATSSSTVEVTSYTPTAAVLRTTDVTSNPNTGAVLTEVSTTSYRVDSDGAVVIDMGGVKERYGTGVFTATGAEVATISPDLPAFRLSLVGLETVTVPAGPFETLKFKSEGGGFEAPVYAWYTRQKGLVRLYYVATQSVEVGSGNATASAVATASIERVLVRFTP